VINPLGGEMIIADQKERGILIIDDDEGIRRSLSERLKREGFRNIHCAEDGLRALTCLELEGPKIYVAGDGWVRVH
jgi:DNA-binding NtrC family response regulator